MTDFLILEKDNDFVHACRRSWQNNSFNAREGNQDVIAAVYICGYHGKLTDDAFDYWKKEAATFLAADGKHTSLWDIDAIPYLVLLLSFTVAVELTQQLRAIYTVMSQTDEFSTSLCQIGGEWWVNFPVPFHDEMGVDTLVLPVKHFQEAYQLWMTSFPEQAGDKINTDEKDAFDIGDVT